jgi:hypothetical protein
MQRICGLVPNKEQGLIMNMSNVAKTMDFADKKEDRIYDAGRVARDEIGFALELSRRTRNMRVGLAVEAILVMGFVIAIAGISFGGN